MRSLFISCLIFLFFIPPHVFSQDKPEKKVTQMDVFDLFLSKEKREKLHGAMVEIKPYKFYISAFPFIGYNPALGLCAGATINPAIYFGDISKTPISAFAINVNITTKLQVLLSFRSSVFTRNADLFLKGDWRFYFYSQPTYGLGSDIVGADSSNWIIHTGDVGYSVTNVAEPMKFFYVRLYETVNKRLVGHFYLGVGYHLDSYFKIVDQYTDTTVKPVRISQHYLYSKEYGFNPEQYTTSGLVLSILYDSRDNSIRPTRGIYACLTPRFNFTFLGSTKNSIAVHVEFKSFIGLSRKNPAHLIAFWFQGYFLLGGKSGYLDLPAIGWDTYGRTGRGYVQGRIRGINFLYGEAEYRFPISKYTRILSGVVFINATTCDSDNKEVSLFEYIAPAAGAGLRVMLNKKSLSNLTIDLGFGLNGSKGLFLNVNETF